MDKLNINEKQLEAIRVIEKNGGSASLARKLNLPKASGTGTVNNWKVRGLPWEFKAKYPELVKSK